MSGASYTGHKSDEEDSGYEGDSEDLEDSGNKKVSDRKKVFDRKKVSDRKKVYDPTKVYAYEEVSGHKKVSGNEEVSGHKKAYDPKKEAGDEEDSGNESVYQSDGGTKYRPAKKIGEGRYWIARLFLSVSNKSVIVLSPVKPSAGVDLGEVNAKLNFFQKVYPKRRSHHFRRRHCHRLVVPYLKYKPYEKLNVDNPELQQILFKSAAKTLRDLHSKNIIYLDLKTDNILFNDKTANSYLIDGGLSVVKGGIIDPLSFQLPDTATVEEYRQEYGHIPPECWSVAPQPVYATEAMDIFSLGVLMLDVIDTPTRDIQDLIDRCLQRDPQQRPTLNELNNRLEALSKLKTSPNEPRPRSKATAVKRSLNSSNTLSNTSIKNKSESGRLSGSTEDAFKNTKRSFQRELHSEDGQKDDSMPTRTPRQ